MARKTRVPASEYGGDDGLIQPASKGHTMTASEAAMALRIRADGDGQGGTRPVGGGTPNRADAEGWPEPPSDALA